MNFSTKLSLAALGLFTTAQGIAYACSCMEPSISASFDTSSDVVIVSIEGRRRRAGNLYYSAKVRRTIKGCTETEERLILATPASSAACGETSLVPGRNYLIFGTEDGTIRDRAVLDINLCDYNTALREVTPSDWRFIRANREECAPGPDCSSFEVDEFGMCDMMLGYGVSAESGMCAAISGCGLPEGIALFNSWEECSDTCELD